MQDIIGSGILPGRLDKRTLVLYNIRTGVRWRWAMENSGRMYIAIDLKSFYASVECVERSLDALTTNLVVADEGRTEKTICLAVSPSLRALGIPGRARLFEVTQRVREINAIRRRAARGGMLCGRSWDAKKLESDESLAVGFIVARPRMSKYMEVSARIYGIYLRFVSPRDIFVYSVDEVFIDATAYLSDTMTARQLASAILCEVARETGLTATAGIGTNMYLAKVAMDIVAKHISADKNGVRIAQLDEALYRRTLWSHTPITDFWRIGPGYAARLAENGMNTMGDVARCSVCNEELLYRLFGVNAELLIDHAWGWEPTTVADVHAYEPAAHSICSGQVLKCAYSCEKARLVVREMAHQLALEMTEKDVVCNQVVLSVGYDASNFKNAKLRREFDGEISEDRFGRVLPKGVHGSHNMRRYTCSARLLTDAVSEIFDRTVDCRLTVRRVNLTVNNVVPREKAVDNVESEQLDMFTDYEALRREREKEEYALEREQRRQRTLVGIQKRYGKNAVIKGMSLEEGATGRERNSRIGGHMA